MIEMINSNEIEMSIKFAEQEILPLVEKDVRLIYFDLKSKLLDQLERVMALLAFENAKESPMKDLVEDEQKIKISSEINYHIRKA
jgi:hypothetical protein